MNFALFLVPLFAQQFEVASVKPYREASIGNQYRVSPNGDLRVVNMSLRELVRTAYGINESQLSGGPLWFAVDRWNIEAKVGDVAPDASRKAAAVRLKALLKDRFQLVTHWESRPLAVLALVQVRSGHKLVPAKPGEEARAQVPGAARSRRNPIVCQHYRACSEACWAVS